MSAAHNLEVFASDEETPEKGFRRVADSDPLGTINRLITSPQFQSPVVDYSTYEPGDMEESGEVEEKDRINNPLHEKNEEAEDAEDLYDETDPAPAEAEIDKIKHYLYYMRGGEWR